MLWTQKKIKILKIKNFSRVLQVNILLKMMFNKLQNRPIKKFEYKFSNYQKKYYDNYNKNYILISIIKNA